MSPPPRSARAAPEIETRNTVHLVGRVSWGPESRVMPSGDEVVQLRVVVPRPRARSRSAPTGEPPGKARTQVDAIEVACWSARTRAAAKRLTVDDMVEVEGGLHRRFFATGAGRASRYEVEARALRRARAARP
ncbi:single-stranded DNA-binding protein [Ornithinimicrobium cryptoxanthini]|uniref:Single-stranded DNA-binding protein n=1 Tax=Ornithinimicrobium cryptoxanthini TaxID=2934161 RepID=A0ABY4YN10_9MICO|nr:single-stranded DNA-binding protein [Ornithinimicrobium cryptoxanthini]USQ77931.1 single-stranded DNA-binding protein [Ornithinimicrobium cryptoxanthini]